jgi:hypothetical protein
LVGQMGEARGLGCEVLHPNRVKMMS